MKKVQYSEIPSVFQEFKNGAITYRWDIQEEEVVQMEGSKTQYSCYEVTIYKPCSKEELTKAVITSIWDNELEKKLINNYNGAMVNLFDEATNAKYIREYQEFLIQRKSVKEQIDIDWNICYK